MLYRNTRSMIISPDRDITFFEITTGVLQGDTLAPFLFICLNYILKTAIDNSTELGFTLTQRRSRRYPALHITDIDYADDIVITTNTMKDANTLLHLIEETADDIGRVPLFSVKTCFYRAKPVKTYLYHVILR